MSESCRCPREGCTGTVHDISMYRYEDDPRYVEMEVMGECDECGAEVFTDAEEARMRDHMASVAAEWKADQCREEL